MEQLSESLGFVKDGCDKSAKLFQELQKLAQRYPKDDPDRAKRVKQMEELHGLVLKNVSRLVIDMDPLLSAKERFVNDLYGFHLLLKKRRDQKYKKMTPEMEKQKNRMLAEANVKFLEDVNEKNLESTIEHLVTLITLATAEITSITEALERLEKEMALKEEACEASAKKQEDLQSAQKKAKWWGIALLGAAVVVGVVCLTPLAPLAAPVEAGLITAICLTGVGGIAAGAFFHHKLKKEKQSSAEILESIEKDRKQMDHHKKIKEEVKQQIKKYMDLKAQVEGYAESVNQAKHDAEAFRHILVYMDTENKYLEGALSNDIWETFADKNVNDLLCKQSQDIHIARFRLHELRKTVFHDMNKDHRIPEDAGTKTLAFSAVDSHGPDPAFEWVHYLSRCATRLCTNTRQYFFVNHSLSEVRMSVYENSKQSILTTVMQAADLVVPLLGNQGVTPETSKKATAGPTDGPEVIVLRPGAETTITKNLPTIYVHAGVYHWGYVARHEYYHMFWENHMIEWSPGKKIVFTRDVTAQADSHQLKVGVHFDSAIVDKKGLG